MKHYIYSVFIVLSIMMFISACTASKKNELPQDTGTNKQKAEAIDTALNVRNESEKTTTYEPGRGDLGSYDLRGPVKKVIYNKWSCTFNEQGQLLTENGRSLKSIFPGGIKRDKNGRLQECNADGYGSRYYTYNAKGLPTEIAEDGYNSKFTYDADGYVKTEINTTYPDMDEMGADEEEQPEVMKSTYTILEKDSCGNWTKRKDQRGKTTTRTIIYF